MRDENGGYIIRVNEQARQALRSTFLIGASEAWRAVESMKQHGDLDEKDPQQLSVNRVWYDIKVRHVAMYENLLMQLGFDRNGGDIV